MDASEYNPDNPMDTTLSEYLQDRLESRKDDINWFLHRQGIDWSKVTDVADNIVEDIFIKGIEQFGCIDDIDQFIKVIQEWPNNSTEIQLYEETIHQHLARTVIKALPIAVTRFRNLGHCFSFSRQMSERARNFLKRLARCYLFGFDNECIIMCRTILDVEFEAEISSDDCIGKRETNKFNRNNQPLFDLYDRIFVAKELGRIDEITYKLADDVRKQGNNAVHKNPTPDIDSLMIIQNALTVIDKLYSTKASQPEAGKETN